MLNDTLQSIIPFYNISADRTRVGMIVFSTSSSITFDFDTSYSATNLINRVQVAGYPSGGTNTASALILARTMFGSTA